MTKISAWPRILGTIAFLLAVISTPVCLARQADSLAGTWKMSSTTPDGDHLDWTLTIVQKDGNYSATMKGSENDAEEESVKEFKVDGAKIHFRVSYQGDEYDIDVTHDGNSLKGSWSGNGQSGETKGEKAGTA